MPARRDYTPEEALAKVERKRESDRLASRRYRARTRLTRQTNAATVSTTRQTDGASYLNGLHRSDAVDAPTPPTPSLPSEIERVGEILAPFADRGYEHVPRFWELAVQQRPGLCLELEAYKIVDWLNDPKNRKRRCNKAFLANWVRGAKTDDRAPDRNRTSAPKPSSNGTTNGHYVQPITQQGRNPGPPDLPLFEAPVQRIDPGEMARFVAGRREVPLKDKLARVKERAR